MNTDIRVAVTFKGHRKRKRLKKMLGDAATDYLIDLWITVAEDRPDGNLSGLDSLDLAIMAGYEGDPDRFVQALFDCQFLDAVDGGYSLHDWHEHNPFAARSTERGDAARLSRLKATDPDLYEMFKERKYTGISAVDLAQARAEAKKAPPKPPAGKKIAVADNVKLTDVERATLVAKYGEEFTVACIAELNVYKSKPGSKKYKSDYLAICKWVVDKVAGKLATSAAKGSPAGGKRAADISDANRDAVLEFCLEGE